MSAKRIKARRAKPLRVNRTDRLIEQASGLVDQGCSREEIGKELGRTPQQVAAPFFRKGLPPPPTARQIKSALAAAAAAPAVKAATPGLPTEAAIAALYQGQRYEDDPRFARSGAPPRLWRGSPDRQHWTGSSLL